MAVARRHPRGAGFRRESQPSVTHLSCDCRRRLAVSLRRRLLLLLLSLHLCSGQVAYTATAIAGTGTVASSVPASNNVSALTFDLSDNTYCRIALSGTGTIYGTFVYGPFPWSSAAVVVAFSPAGGGTYLASTLTSSINQLWDVSEDGSGNVFFTGKMMSKRILLQPDYSRSDSTLSRRSSPRARSTPALSLLTLMPCIPFLFQAGFSSTQEFSK